MNDYSHIIKSSISEITTCGSGPVRSQNLSVVLVLFWMSLKFWGDQNLETINKLWVLSVCVTEYCDLLELNESQTDVLSVFLVCEFFSFIYCLSNNELHKQPSLNISVSEVCPAHSVFTWADPKPGVMKRTTKSPRRETLNIWDNRNISLVCWVISWSLKLDILYLVPLTRHEAEAERDIRVLVSSSLSLVWHTGPLWDRPGL